MSRFEEISDVELDGLIERVESAIRDNLALSVADMQRLLQALMMLVQLQDELSNQKVTLHKLRKLAGIVQSSEKLRAVTNGTIKPRNRRTTKPSPSTEPVIQEQCHHSIEEVAKGDICPECQRGKLYKYDPAVVLRICGQTPLIARQHILERLRCNTCGAYFTATVPQSVQEDGDISQKYGYSARAIMAIHKHFAGLPMYRQQTLQQMFGVPVSASTIFDQNEQVANAIQPIYLALQQLAGSANHYHLDDTGNRILNQGTVDKPDRKTGKRQPRSGVYTSGVIATMADGQPIILFQTNIGHAGEWLDEILRTRPKGAAPPILMSDALSRNRPGQLEVGEYLLTLCNAHARREFVDLIDLFPDIAPGIVEQYSAIWNHDAYCKVENYTPAQRLHYHQQHSLPIMQTLQQQMQQQLESGEVEENSRLGQAMGYFLRHYEGLTGFCRIEGAQLDNNLMETMLKLVIRGRKNALFYKTLAGAAIADVIMSVIATCYQAGINPFDYLIQLQRHAATVRSTPLQWLPWNYQQTVEQLQIAA